MQFRSTVLISMIALAACAPRRPPPAPAPAPAPAPVVTAESEAFARSMRAEAAFEQGIALGRQSRWSEAADAYRVSIGLMPAEPRFHMALAEALLQGGREWESAEALQAGIRAEEALVRPNHRVLAVDYERLIRLLTRLNRLDEARAAQDRQNQHRRARDQAPPE